MLSSLIAVQGLNTGLPAGRTAVRSQGMSMMADRTPLMAGNWKMNTVLDEATALAKEVAAAAAENPNVDVAVCAPAPFLAPVADVLSDSKVGLGAQDCHWEASGAYTGAPLLQTALCSFSPRGRLMERCVSAAQMGIHHHV